MRVKPYTRSESSVLNVFFLNLQFLMSSTPRSSMSFTCFEYGKVKKTSQQLEVLEIFSRECAPITYIEDDHLKANDDEISPKLLLHDTKSGDS